MKKEVQNLHDKKVCRNLRESPVLHLNRLLEILLKTVEDDVKHDTAKLVKELTTKAKEDAEKKAKEYVVTAIQKCAADHVSVDDSFSCSTSK